MHVHCPLFLQLLNPWPAQQDFCISSANSIAFYTSSEPKCNLAKNRAELTMIHSKKLAQLAKKWRRMLAAGAGAGARRQAVEAADDDECCSTVTDKGHCVVYAADGARFEVPLAYLGTAVFGELLRMSGEEFGFASGDGGGGRITLPCDAAVMEYVVCLVRREASEEVERAFLSSIVGHCHSHDAGCVAPSLGLNHQFALCT